MENNQMLRAMIFDCDGVIADSEPLHLAAFQKILSEEGITLTQEDYYQKYLAMDDKSCFESVLMAHGRTYDKRILKDLIIRKMAAYRQLSEQKLSLYPGVVDFVRKAQGAYRLAIASGAFRGEIKFALEAAGLRSAFPVIVGAQDVRNGKPHPEALLLALRQINEQPPRPSPPIQPEECLVIEDSIHGVDAAHAAGMKCLAVTNSYPKEKLARADLIISSLEEMELKNLERLFT
jgi:HAD superfamily hydrolase (TIGR01509 family)